MSPDATIGLLHLLDHWQLMLMQMRGEPLPPLPAVLGRVHRLPEPTSVEADAAELDAAQVWRALAADSEGGDVD